MARLGLKDIARALGVSESTVSLALNDRPAVNADTRRRVLDYVAEVGYTPNPMARGLAIQKSMAIGLVCPDTENPYYGSFVRHITDNCEKYNYSLMLSLSGHSLEREATILKTFVDKQVDGVIIMPQDAVTNPHANLQRFADADIPVVFCTSSYQGYADDCVRGDYWRGAYELTRWMLEHGHRELWYLVTANTSIPVASERIRGYRSAYADLGLPLDETWIVGSEEISSESGEHVIRDLLRSRPLPDGILTLNDYMAFGVIRGLEELGYTVPDDVSVAGYDDVFYAAIARTPLTTVGQNLSAISEKCVSLLMRRVRGDNTPIPLEERLVAPTLIVRETTTRR